MSDQLGLKGAELENQLTGIYTEAQREFGAHLGILQKASEQFNDLQAQLSMLTQTVEAQARGALP